MKNLIQHLINNNLDEIVSKSLLNCHVKGVHSIMFCDTPEKTIRLFVSDNENDLYKNLYSAKHDYKMSVGFHSHHCNVTLDVIKGTLQNWIIEIPTEVKGNPITQWKYNSPIKKQGYFEKRMERHILTQEVKNLSPGQSIHLKSTDIHTVACPEGQRCAWFVYEGKEDKNYYPYCYSNTDLAKESFEGLYQKPTKDDIFDLLIIAGIL